jgi:hypothetical protein
MATVSTSQRLFDKTQRLEQKLNSHLLNHHKTLLRYKEQLVLVKNTISPTWLLILSRTPKVFIMFQYCEYTNKFNEIWLTQDNLKAIQSLIL